MRILFAGSPSIAVPSLEALVQLEAEDTRFFLAGLLTNPDSPRGRSGRSEPTELALAADRLAETLAARKRPPLVQIKAEKLNGEIREEVAALRPELLVSFAYGRIFGPKFLSLFPLGGINIHPSLLPKYRGATPIPAAILNRDRESGISIQRLALEMDAGDILLQEQFPLTGREDTGSLSAELAGKSAPLLISVLKGLEEGKITGTPQDDAGVSYTGLIAKEDGRIDWKKTALDIDAEVRAYTPWPLSLCTWKGQELYILEAAPFGRNGPLPHEGGAGRGPFPEGQTPEAPLPEPGSVLGTDKQAGILIQTGDGILAVSRLQLKTKKALYWKDFLNGTRDFIGSRLE